MKNSILERHQCIIDVSGKIGLKEDVFSLKNALENSSPIIFLLVSILLYFCDFKFLSLSFGIIGSILLFGKIEKDSLIEIPKNILSHDDFINISEVMSKEELQTLISFYEYEFYKEEKNQIYKFDIYDLLNPINIEKNPEAAKIVHKQKLNQYLDSV